MEDEPVHRRSGCLYRHTVLAREINCAAPSDRFVELPVVSAIRTYDCFQVRAFPNGMADLGGVAVANEASSVRRNAHVLSNQKGESATLGV